jgi:hypothetical protein
VGDAARDRCVDRLSAALASGQIDTAEFDHRSDTALRARTQLELDRLTADLDPVAPVRAGQHLVLTEPAIAKMVIFAGVSFVLCLGVGRLLSDSLVPLIITWLFSLISAGVGMFIATPRNDRRSNQS